MGAEFRVQTPEAGAIADIVRGGPTQWGRTRAAAPARSRGATTLKELGISKDQSSRWQALAGVPDEDFEAALGGEVKPTTNGIIAKPLKMPETSLWLWGRLRDFEHHGLPDMRCDEATELMTDAMLADVRRLAPLVAAWLEDLANDIRLSTSALPPASDVGRTTGECLKLTRLGHGCSAAFSLGRYPCQSCAAWKRPQTNSRNPRAPCLSPLRFRWPSPSLCKRSPQVARSVRDEACQ